MKFFDVTVPLSPGVPSYPDNPPFALEPLKRIAQGGPCNLSALHMSAHAGTHVDAPCHFIDGTPGIESLSLDLLMGRARVVHVPVRKGIDADQLASLDLSDDLRLLLKTHNSALWLSGRFSTEYAHLTESAARLLVDRGIKVVGIDYLSIEQFGSASAPAHKILLGAGLIVIEGLNLLDVEPGIYDMYCLPLPIVGGDGAPARVVLRQS